MLDIINYWYFELHNRREKSTNPSIRVAMGSVQSSTIEKKNLLNS